MTLAKDPVQAWIDAGRPGGAAINPSDGARLCASANPLGVAGLPCSFAVMPISGGGGALACVKCGEPPTNG